MIGVSALPLLAYKVGPNLFDLSSQMYNVSMRDQMHRAVALAEALVSGNQFNQTNSSEQVLIVGAGVAGVSAGIVLARHGIEVLIIDSSPDAPFALQRDVKTRFVGPYMYEWPLEVFKSQYLPSKPHTALAVWHQKKNQPPLSFGTAAPARPATLVKAWERQLERSLTKSGGRLHVQLLINSAQSNAAIGSWLAAQRGASNKNLAFAQHEVTITGGAFWRSSTPVTGAFTPRFVLLASGMGAETHSLPDANAVQRPHGFAFWGNDQLLNKYCGKTGRPDVAILGGGDGALQDVLRALTGDEQPLKTWDKLLAEDMHGLFAGCQQRILALEQQHAHLSIWSHVDNLRDAYATLDGAYRALAKGLAQFPHVVDSVFGLMRNDVKNVQLFVRDDYFSKSYSLNRFLVHLFNQCAQVGGTYKKHANFQVLWNMTLKHAVVNGAKTDLTFTTGVVHEADIVAVRFGADTTKLPKTWLGLTQKDTENRQELAAIPLPLFMPPSV